MKGWNWLFLSLIAVGAFVLASGGSITPFDPKPKLVIMLYETLHGPLPPYALGAARELNDAGFEVRPTDDDEVTGLGEIPGWLKPALEPGRVIMGGQDDAQQKDDALILMNGERVLKAIKLPATKAEILEAVK